MGRHDSWPAAGVVLVCALVVGGLYGPVLSYPFVYDDVALIAQNPALGDWRTLAEALTSDLFHFSDGVRPSPYWRPVVTLSYYVDHWIGGGAPRAFHWTNLALLTACGAALIGLLVRLGSARGTAVLLGVIFLAHPLQVEGAANIAGRTDLLCGLFLLGALAWRHPLGSAGLVLLACGAKEIAIVTPVVMWLLDRADRRWRWQGAAVLVFLGARAVVVQGLDLLPEDLAGPSVASLAGAGARVWFWLGRIAWPVPMGPAADLAPAVGLVAAAGWVGLAGALALATRLAPAQRASAALVVLPLALVSGLVQTSPRYGDTLTVVPLAGLALLLGTLARPGVGRLGLLGLPLTLALGGAARDRVPEWRSSEALWEAAHARAPEDRVVTLSVARMRLATNPQQAADVLDPLVWPQGSRQRREAAAVEAKALLAQGLEDQALPWLGQAVADDPEASWANGTACVLLAARGSRAAAGVCELAVGTLADDPDVLNAMGITRIATGGPAEALPWFTRAAALAPDRPELVANRDRAATALSDP